VTAYLDGTSFGTTANTGAASEHTLTLGSYGNTALFTGYIDEFRLLVGTAVWTDAFTPPGEPYAFSISDMNLRSTASATSAVSKTDLLLNVALPEGAVLNTDVCGYVSVDGGATFSQVTLAQQSDNGDGSVRLFGSLTGLTAGESLCIKVAAAGSAGVTQVWDWAILAGA
jgi:hypothetical protein